MSQTIESILNQLARTFTVRDIMIPVSTLTRAADPAEAQQILHEHPEFDVIPLPQQGPIGGYFCRDSGQFSRVQTGDLLGDGTSLLDLPELLVDRKFYFVLSSSRVGGYLHFSDLNKGLVKLPLFVLFEAVERQLWAAIQPRITEADLAMMLDPQRANNVIKKRARKQNHNVDMGWAGLFSFDEIVRFSIHYGQISLSSTEQEILANYRNRVAHSDKDLINDHRDIKKLVTAVKLCQTVLKNMAEWSAQSETRQSLEKPAGSG